MLESGELESTRWKVMYDRTAVERKVEEGSEVLLRQPSLMGKLESAWVGPYVIVRKIGETDVEVRLSGTGKKQESKVVHVNLTKPYHDPGSRVLRIMVVAEDKDEVEQAVGLSGDCQMEGMGGVLQEVITRYKDVITPKPGCTQILVAS